MKLFQRAYDGGKDSGVTGFWLIEIKSLFSIVFLKFNPGSRENFHSHAFNALTIWLKGDVTEQRLGDLNRLGNRAMLSSSWPASGRFKWTPKDNIHRVIAHRPTYAICFRGPWDKTWQEVTPEGEVITLTHGRKVVEG